MSTRSFAINTEPHVAKVGESDLHFQPEVIGAEFAEAYDAIRTVQLKVKAAQGNKASSSKHAKDDDVDSSVLAELSLAMRSFVGKFLVDDHERETFSGMRIPDRVLVQLMEWVAELYGSGSGNRDAAGGTSSA